MSEAALLEREEPLARLEQALATARQKRGRVMSLEGEAGIGKTSLVLRFAESHRRDARVYVGGCEHLVTPEPLGPLRDIARASQGRFSVSTASSLTTFEALLRLLETGERPALLILEDIHWADDSTLDLLRYLGRRIRSAPILIVVTFRNDEADSQPRLAALWADMPRDCSARVELPPLSAAAVSRLAGGSGMAAREVYAATGGNPFHVTEYLATPPPTIPHGVRDATLARAARLSERARRTLECASIFPRRIEEQTLCVLADDTSHAGVEECLRGGMLNAREGVLAFRHELARRAIHDAMAPLRQRALHAEALRHLETQPQVRASECAHHAQHAGAFRELVDYSIRAADEAAVLGAHRECMAHLARALAHATWLDDAQRARLLEREAESGELCGAFDLATPAIAQAIEAYERAGDVLGLGNALRISSRLHWQHGEPEAAERLSQRALEVLREHRDSWQYAMALSGQSQLDMLADRNDLAVPRATEAMERAERLGRSDIYLHALTNANAARSSQDPDTDVTPILQAIEEVRRRSEPDFLPRMYSNLTYMMTSVRRYPHLFEYFEQGIASAAARENAPLEGYMRGTRAHALVDLGRLREAVAEAEFVVYGPYPRGTVRFTASIALARARARLGLPDDGALDAARALPTAHRDLMRLAPLAVTDAEALWLGLPRPEARTQLRAAFDMALRSQGQGWTLADTALWLTILGERVEIPPPAMSRLRNAHRLHIQGAWREAAAAWAELGCPYEQAIALTGGDEDSQRAALALFDELGATPAAARLRREMRARGVQAIPRGPIASTRASPAGLTRRQRQVLSLVGAGLSNAQIAGRLHISAKTAEHHVSAIMEQLGARTRGEAAEAARARGLLEDLEK